MLESKFKSNLIEELRHLFEGCIILHNDPNDVQGMPDLLILYNNKWAVLECKKSINSPRRPNQQFYVDVMDEMSFASFIYPENKEEVLDELQCTFNSRRSTRFSKC